LPEQALLKIAGRLGSDPGRLFLLLRCARLFPDAWTRTWPRVCPVFCAFSSIHFPFLHGIFSVLWEKAFAKPVFFITPTANRLSAKYNPGWVSGASVHGGSFAAALVSLDVGTLFFVSVCVTVLLGLFPLHAWLQEGNRALALWSGAYLIGGAAGVLWRFGDALTPALPPGSSTALMFVAVGMTWSGARCFHGRPTRWSAMAFGAGFWIAASFFPAFAASAASHMVVSALIVAGYTFLTARVASGAPQIADPPLACRLRSDAAPSDLSVSGDGGHTVRCRGGRFRSGARLDRAVCNRNRSLCRRHGLHRIDPRQTSDRASLSHGGRNRSAHRVVEPAQLLRSRRKPHGDQAGRQRQAPVSVLVFDLGRFKAINDQNGHGDR
jgi:hypothetical protein